MGFVGEKSRFALFGDQIATKNISKFPQFLRNRISVSPSKKNIRKIHFLIFPKQNTFTKPEKLKNCVNIKIIKTKLIIILFFTTKNRIKTRLDLVLNFNTKHQKIQHNNYGNIDNINAKWN